MKEQLKTVKGDLANPLDNENRVFSQWTKNFTNVPDFRFPDLFNYLVGKDPVYSSESLKSYKSGAPNENIVQNHLNISLLNVF